MCTEGSYSSKELLGQPPSGSCLGFQGGKRDMWGGPWPSALDMLCPVVGLPCPHLHLHCAQCSVPILRGLPALKRGGFHCGGYLGGSGMISVLCHEARALTHGGSPGMAARTMAVDPCGIPL